MYLLISKHQQTSTQGTLPPAAEQFATGRFWERRTQWLQLGTNGILGPYVALNRLKSHKAKTNVINLGKGELELTREDLTVTRWLGKELEYIFFMYEIMKKQNESICYQARSISVNVASMWPEGTAQQGKALAVHVWKHGLSLWCT